MQNHDFYTMFTGIIESLAEVQEIGSSGSNKTFWLSSPLSPAFKVDQSVSHDGVCLTIEDVAGNVHRVTAVAETLNKTALGKWKPGSLVNLERSLLADSRVDGHFVQGHVDATGTCEKIRNRDGSHEITFRFPKKFAPLVIEKGSICVNGISLTAFNVGKKTFTVAIIPYTYNHTGLRNLKEGMPVNLEFDMMGKYILRKLSLD